MRTISTLMAASLIAFAGACSEAPDASEATDSGSAEADSIVALPDTSSVQDNGSSADVPDVQVPAVADFGQPCVENAECSTGWCVEGPTGYVCSQPCIDSCPFGYLCKSAQIESTDILFLCVPLLQRLCEPCLTDAQCPDGSCETVGDDGQTFCTAPCGTDNSCPDGYSCNATDGAQSARCLPNTGSCTCTTETTGAKRTCSTVNEFGTCAGWETCDPSVGWTDCNAVVATDEICDGLDNDCDALIDDGIPLSQPCETTGEFGTCPGQARCFGDEGWLCDAPTAATETCDFQDNDCTGAVDEPFVNEAGVYALVEHCGSCGNSCEGKYPGAATVACKVDDGPPLCIVEACKPGFFKLSDFQCIVPPNAACKPCANAADCFGADCIEVQGASVCSPTCTLDTECETGLNCLDGHCLPPNGTCDCDGDSEGAKKSCSVQSDVGTCFGFQTCDPEAGWSACDAEPASVEMCDGFDNDCNGEIDDGIAAPACDQLSTGICKGALKQCGGGAGWLPCGTATLPTGYEPVELSCDDVDNDCDGEVDEALAKQCPLNTGVCADVVDGCVDGLFTGCQYGAEYEAKELSCDGFDNDCDGLTDNVDVDNDGFVSVACGGGDCDDSNGDIHPAADEDCATPADDDCSGTANDKDLDFDGFTDPACGGNDCNDGNPLVHGSAVEVCGDGLDNDCSGTVDDKDSDHDDHIDTACGGDDCNDLNPLVFLGADEICGDQLDNDCNGTTEDKDTDNDLHIDAACGGDDCNDQSDKAYPGLDEVCGDGLDNDCDGSVDNKDIDGDSFLDPACGGTDCDDDETAVHPGNDEICDGLDNDCNSVTDDKDLDHDGHRDMACPGGDDCDDSSPFISPSADEICGDVNELDEDCSGADGDKDVDGDGFLDIDPACDGGDDCDDLDPQVYPNATEIYDTKDTDCDGVVDEGLIAPGTVIISEMMINPAAADDSLAEWFEVTNVGILPVNLASWTISDENTPTPDSFQLNAIEKVLVPPGGTAVLCRNPNPLLNGGVTCDGGYDDVILAQKGDEIVMSLDGVEIDTVAYLENSAWPNVLAGVSMMLDPNQLSASGNDLPSSWCNTPTGDENKLPGGDRGTPGAINPSCSGAPAVTSVVPGNGVDNGGELINIQGSGFTGVNDVAVGPNSCQSFEIVSDNLIRCVTPPGNAGDVAVTVQKGAESSALDDGYRFTGEAITQIDWCDLQWPPTVSGKAGQPTVLIFGQVHAPALTALPGAPPGLMAELGYGPLGSDPRNAAGWAWTPASWHDQQFSNDEFKQTLTVPATGEFSYTFRFSDDGGTHFIYCDFDPGTADGFSASDLGHLTSTDF